MLYVFGVNKVGVVLGDLFFLDFPRFKTRSAAEHGVRLEVRLLERLELRGSIYSSPPIEVGLPVWRADLLQRVSSPPHSFDMTHHHPLPDGWDFRSDRVYEPEMQKDPLEFVAGQLRDIRFLIERAGYDPAIVTDPELEELREIVPDIIAATRRLLDKIANGDLAAEPADIREDALIRVGWL